MLPPLPEGGNWTKVQWLTTKAQYCPRYWL
jgi:hypothetical protein